MHFITWELQRGHLTLEHLSAHLEDTRSLKALSHNENQNGGPGRDAVSHRDTPQMKYPFYLEVL